jgi:hypothetical protein
MELNMGKLGVVAPFEAKEGDITIATGAGAFGEIKVPTLAAGLVKGDWVELDGDMTVKKLTGSGVGIGIVYNTPKWVEGEPTTSMNQSAAVSAGALREAGIETIFKKILTVDVTGSVSAGNYLVADTSNPGKFKASASSGTTASDVIALTAKDSNNKSVVGFI